MERKQRFRYTIKGKIRLSYSFILAAVLGVLAVTYFVSKMTIERNAVQSRMSALKVFAERIDSQGEYVLNLSDLIYNSSAVNKYIREMGRSQNAFEKHYYYAKLYRTMQDFTDTMRNSGRNYQILLCNEKREVVYYSWEHEEPDEGLISKDIRDNEKSGSFRYAKVHDSYKKTEEDQYLYFFNEYKKIGTQEDLYVIVGTPLEAFVEMTDMLLEDGDQVSLFSQEELLYTSMDIQQKPEKIKEGMIPEKTEGCFQKKEDEEHWIHLYTSISSMDWKLVTSVKRGNIMQDFEEWWKISVFCLAGVLAAVSVVMYYLNKSILAPVKKLHEDMQRVKEGIKELQVPRRVSEDEIGNLTRQFYDMVDRIDSLERETLLNEKQKRKLEMEALQAQINPHFLYNTINAVKMLLRMKCGEEARAALTALADILKHTLSDSSQTVLLEEEIKILSSYIFIQKLRYEEFSFHLEIEERLKSCRIMKFMIQPFIENSFLHGFEEISAETEIKVTIREEKGRLNIWIKDNGEGMEKSVIEEILSCKKRGEGVNGIGIGNVIERIERSYGNPYGVEIVSAVGKGTCIRLLLPIIKEE